MVMPLVGKEGEGEGSLKEGQEKKYQIRLSLLLCTEKASQGERDGSITEKKRVQQTLVW